MRAPCIIPRCGKPRHGRKLCRSHYYRLVTMGRPPADLPTEQPGPVMPWANRALCTQTADPDLWFRDDSEAEAKAICQQCPVRAECLACAMDRRLWHPESGVWGGLAAGERRALARGQERVA